MPKKTKFVRVAVEGATTDGRAIARQHIEEMAASYDPKVYGARLNLEHLRALYPDSVFRAYGDVLALKTEEITEGALIGKLALLAQMEVTDELVQLNRKRQKVYSSIEFTPSFADSGHAYLQGIAFTDTPASLGTELLTFCANASANPLAARKTTPDSLFSAAEEVLIELSEDPAPEPEAHFLSKLKGLLGGQKRESSTEFAALKAGMELLADNLRQQGEALAQLSAAAPLTALEQRFAALEQQLSTTPATQLSAPRPLATGSDALAETVDY
ncbi:MAG: GPO family capsid scaffolding protein [Aeromonas sp.]